MAAAQAAVKTVKTAAAVAEAAPKVAQDAVQTATDTVNAIPGAPQAVQAGQGAVETAQNAVATAGNAAVTNVPGMKQVAQAGQTALETAQNVGQTAAQAATRAITSVPGGQMALNAVPKPILDILYRIVTLNKLDWGKPQAVVVMDGRYFFIYPSNAIPIIQKNQPRIIVVDTMSRVDRLLRLQKYGY
jgi:predicted DCC family thiol-disulfide oxidoreductase YuxK